MFIKSSLDGEIPVLGGNSRAVKLLVLCLILILSVCSDVYAQFPMDAKSDKQLIVETVIRYSESNYKTSSYAPAADLLRKSSPDTPEHVLLSYLAVAARGDVPAARALWDGLGQSFIRKKSSGLSESEISTQMKALHADLQVRFLRRIEANGYVVLQIEKQYTRNKSEEGDWFALRKEDGRWKLTQDLADEELACCIKPGTDRIRKVGSLGGDFRRVLEALQK